MSRPVYTTSDVALHFGCRPWQVRRVFERGLLPPAARVGIWRIATDEDLPAIEEALRKAGYLPRGQEVASC